MEKQEQRNPTTGEFIAAFWRRNNFVYKKVRMAQEMAKLPEGKENLAARARIVSNGLLAIGMVQGDQKCKDLIENQEMQKVLTPGATPEEIAKTKEMFTEGMENLKTIFGVEGEVDTKLLTDGQWRLATQGRLDAVRVVNSKELIKQASEEFRKESKKDDAMIKQGVEAVKQKVRAAVEMFLPKKTNQSLNFA